MNPQKYYKIICLALNIIDKTIITNNFSIKLGGSTCSGIRTSQFLSLRYYFITIINRECLPILELYYTINIYTIRYTLLIFTNIIM